MTTRGAAAVTFKSRWVEATHRWLGAIVVVPTLAWFISGLVLFLPPDWQTSTPALMEWDAERASAAEPVSWRDASITPAAAVAALEAQLGSPVDVERIDLRRLPGRVVFDILIANDRHHLVDARSADVFVVDAHLATRIVQPALGPLPVPAPTRDDVPTPGYRGSGPYFRFDLADGHGTLVFVEEATGAVSFRDQRTLLVRLASATHTFDVLELVGFVPRATRVSLWVAGVLGIGMTLTGAWILVKRVNRWRVRRRAA